MSQKEVINDIVNVTLGWKNFNTEVYYVANSDHKVPKVMAGWYVKSDILVEEYYLGANYKSALSTIVIGGHDMARVSSIMEHIKKNDCPRFDNTCKLLKMNEPLQYFFPEFEEDVELEVVYATLSDKVKSFVMGAVCVTGVAGFLFWKEIVLTIVGMFGYVH